MNSTTLTTRSQQPPESSRAAFFVPFCTVLIFCAAAMTVQAADPAKGSVNSTVGSKVTFTGSATASGAPNGEGDCMDGINCDTFELTITGNPADYVGKVVAIRIDWTVPTNDYDLVIHKGTVDGPVLASSGNGPPLTYEKAAIRPSDHGTGKYIVHVIYFATVPQVDQYNGVAKTQLEPVSRTGTYIKGGIGFSPNLTVKAPVARRDGEPSSRTDVKGNFYISGIRGVPAGIDLWYFDLNPSSSKYDPLMRNPIYRGQPDSFTSTDAADLGADGGGDVDLAVGFGTPSGQSDPTLAFSSLVLANVSTGNSTDRAQTYNHNPAGNVNGAPVNDRQWQEFFDDHIEFLTYRTFDPVFGVVQRSTDGGLTYDNGTVIGGVAQNGGIDVHHKDGTVYVSYNDGRVAVGIPANPGDAPASYDLVQAVDHPNGVGHLFCIVKAAEDGTPHGTVYVAYSDGKNVFLAYSTDRGKTWSTPVRVSDLPGGTCIFPAMETGPTPGSVAIAWYGAPNQPFNNNDCNWHVYFSQTFNATAVSPTFTQVEASDHIIHASNISEGGLNGNANRNLLDYFQISFDPHGAAVIGYTDDHNDFTGHTYVTRQTSGPSIKGGGATISLPNPIPSVSPPAGDAAPPPQPGPHGEQVMDFAQDAVSGSNLTRINSPNPADILSIKYSSSVTAASKLLLTATMKLSALPALPPSATYRMTFTANAPDATISATGDNTYGVSDRGDQFFFAVTTDQTGTPTYRYGTAVRNSDGSITYTNASPTPTPSPAPSATPTPSPSPTPVGIADSGSFDPSAGTVSVTVDVARLNQILLAQGHQPIQTGSVLVGLRGTASAGQQSDDTRGGTVFVVGGGTAPTPTPTPSASPSPSVSPSASPSPSTSPSASPSPSTSPSASPTPTPTPSPGATPTNLQLLNISARSFVQVGDKVGIGGFIIAGNTPKRVVVRGIGPSMKSGNAPVAGRLADPFLELHDQTGAIIATNDNWKESPEAPLIMQSGLAPSDDREAAIETLLPPSGYTGVLRGANNGTGIGLVEIFDLDSVNGSELANLSSRAQVLTGDDVLIGGLILRGGNPKRVLFRGIGPELHDAGVTGELQDPTLELRDENGALRGENDDWKQATNSAEIQNSGAAPKNDKEAAILMTLTPGNYTGILRGANKTTGVGLIEGYKLD